MILIVISLIIGFLGFSIGSLGGKLLAYIFCFIGILSPAFFVLEKIYKRNRYSNEVKNDIRDDALDSLDSLRSNGILADIEYEKACSKFNEIKEKTENRTKYDNGVDILYKLSEGDIISENEFHEKIRALKTLYKQ